MFAQHKYFLPYQIAWIEDKSRLKIIEKSRQIGITYTDAYDSVRKALPPNAEDVFVSSKDEFSARLYLDMCKRWARVLHVTIQDLGVRIIDHDKDLKAMVVRLSSGKHIYAMSSNHDAMVGKTGHIKLDEFAVHQHQRELFKYAKPCTTWGGQVSIISTHRGSGTLFNELIREIKEQGNPKGFSHHRVDIFDAVRQGLARKINDKNGTHLADEEFIAQLRTESLDEEHWLQEYCCQPADENSAFITHEMISAAESPNCLKPFSYLDGSCGRESAGASPSPRWGEGRGEVSCSSEFRDPHSAFYIGVDVARKKHLCVIDVGEKIGDVMWDRYRIELQDKTFSEIKHELYRILSLPKVQRCCIDASGLGMQLAEEAKQQFGWKVEPITFTAPVKEELAFELRHCFEDRLLRIDPSPALRSDLRGIKKETTIGGNIRFVGESEDSHCDRFWAKALRQHAAQQRREFFAIVIE